MASRILMEEPVCLVGNGADGELEVNPVALKILGGINQPLVVVAIVGLYRTGKSYLMNSLAGKRKGFSLGATVQSHTKGIWMWCVPHPRSPGHTLVLLDTEGLGDVEKGSTKNDHWIFALAVLLSSTLVYNSKGTIDQYAMEQLHFVSELTEHIKVKAQEEDDLEEDTEFVRFFPNFIWAVRDFTLKLEIEGKPVTEDEYLEHALKLKSGVSKKVQDYNLPRQCLRNFFPTRKCFIFVQPVSRQDISQLESLPESSLDPQFLDQTRKFCQYTFQESQPKTLKGGYRVNGRRFSSLVQSYVETILSGKVPCLENAVTSMAAIENEAAVKEALGHYMTEMEKLRLPMEQKELSEVHWKCEEKALQVFMQRSFKDEEQKYQKELVVGIAKCYEDVIAKNEDASVKTCHALLEELSATMRQKLSEGVYSQPGGYETYVRDRNQVVANFRAKPNKGVKAAESLDQFLASKRAEAEAVLQADNMLTEAEKHLAIEKQKAELLEQQKAAEEEKRLQLEQLMKDQERSHMENMKQLEAKIAEEAADIKKEAERALACKLKEQGELMQKGFDDRARLMEQEISGLRKEIDSKQKSDLLASVVGALGEGLRFASTVLRKTRTKGPQTKK